MDKINRRNFVKAATAAGAMGGLSVSASTSNNDEYADAAPTETTASVDPNIGNSVLSQDVTTGKTDAWAGKEIRVALIGCGGRGSGGGHGAGGDRLVEGLEVFSSACHLDGLEADHAAE